MIQATFRPISSWPGERRHHHSRSPFSAGWSTTLSDLDRELRALGAERVVIEIDVDETMIRLDGWPRADARPASPAVVLSFESRYGPLRYATDVFRSWQDNLRAIALGLEALRRVDRYGITRRGEQYTGWRQLTAGAGSGPFTKEEAAAVIARHGVSVAAALKATHPDHGGDPDEFARVQRARELLGVS